MISSLVVAPFHFFLQCRIRLTGRYRQRGGRERRREAGVSLNREVKGELRLVDKVTAASSLNGPINQLTVRCDKLRVYGVKLEENTVSSVRLSERRKFLVGKQSSDVEM